MRNEKTAEFGTIFAGIFSYALGRIAVFQGWNWHEVWNALASLGSFMGGLAAFGGLLWMLYRHAIDKGKRS